MQKTVMLDAEREIYLVQRLNERNIGIYSGVDVYFSMDFMGSSEFEWGARPLSLKHQRENKYFEFSPSVVQVTLGDKNYEAWYIGPPEHLEKIRDWFLLELQGGTKMKGSSFIRLAYKVQETKSTIADVIGWWDISNHWTLFKTKEFAEKWIRGLLDNSKRVA